MGEFDTFKKQQPPMDEADFRSFLSVTQGLSEKTIVVYASRFRRVKEWLLQSSQELTPLALERFLYEQKIGNIARNNYVYFFKKLEEYFEHRGITIQLKKGFKIGRVEKDPNRFLTKDELNLLLNTRVKFKIKSTVAQEMDEKYRIFTAFLYYACARFEEASVVKVSAFDLSEFSVLLTKTKGKKPRKVFLPDHFMPTLLPLFERKGLDDYLFTNRMGNTFNNNDYAASLKRRAKVAGIKLPKQVKPHMLRGTGARHLLKNGVPIQVVSGILGHAQLDTTDKHYNDFEDEEAKKEAVKRFPSSQKKINVSEMALQIKGFIEGLKLTETEKFKDLNKDLMIVLLNYTS